MNARPTEQRKRATCREPRATSPLPGGIYASPTHGGSAYTNPKRYRKANGHGPHACGPYEPARNDRQMGKAGICRRARTANTAQNREAVIGQQILKSVPAGGHAPTAGTPPGKFCPKLCARPSWPSARFWAKFCRRGFQRGCGAERRLRRMQRGGAGAAVAERKRHTWRVARCGTATRPTGALGTAVRDCCPF